MVYAFAPIAGHHIIGWIVIGLVAGLLAGLIVDGGGFGIVRDTLVGLAGAVIGGLLFHVFLRQGHTSPSFLVELIVAFVGAVILLLIAKVFARGGARRV